MPRKGEDGYNEAVKQRILKLIEEGKTDDEVAAGIGVCRKTLSNWKGKYPSLLYAINDMKGIADKLVEASLFQRATGFSHPEEKVFCHEGQIITHETVKQYPPDTAAAIIWLKNRQPKRWREKMPGEADKIVVGNLSDAEIDAKIEKLIAKRGGGE